MTDEARRIYYSPAHWEKMLADQIEYVRSISSGPFDCSSANGIRRRFNLRRSAIDQLNYFKMNANVMRGCSGRKWKRRATLLVDGVNYGLMLEGLRQKVHADINKKFKLEFDFINLKYDVIAMARSMREFSEGF